MFIKIKSSAQRTHELAEMLRNIAAQIDGGYTSGHEPTWEIEQYEEDE